MAEGKEIVLSYIMTTFNKLNFLKVTLPQLIEACAADEEIVIADGGSTDGTREYLEELYKQRKIHQFVSEKDAGEAHGTNKTMLMARGELIKIITDDDVYHYPSISRCKSFMLKNNNIDILGFDGFGLNINHTDFQFVKANYVSGFKKWKIDKTPFLFCGLSYLIRKSSLAYMGLFNTNFKIVDIEYSIRVSSMQTNIAFYTGFAYVNIVNPASNSHKFYKTIDKEKKLLKRMYPILSSEINTSSLTLKLKEFISEKILKRRAKAINFNYPEIVSASEKILVEYNQDKHFEFI